MWGFLGFLGFGRYGGFFYGFVGFVLVRFSGGECWGVSGYVDGRWGIMNSGGLVVVLWWEEVGWDFFFCYISDFIPIYVSPPVLPGYSSHLQSINAGPRAFGTM